MSTTTTTTKPIVEGQLSLVYSGGASNSNNIQSVGGEPSNFTVVPNQVNDVWMNITTPQLQPGIILYRELYIRNTSTTTAFTGIRAWFSKPMSVGGATVYMAASVKPPFTNPKTGSDALQADDGTEPPNLTWAQPNTQSTGIAIPDIPASGWCGLHLKLVVGPNAFTAPDECYTLRIQGSNNGGGMPSSTEVQYGGGPVKDHGNLYFVFWGASYGSGGADKAFADSMISGIQKLTSSIYFSKLSQYSSIATPTYKSSAVNTSTAIPSGSFSSSDARQALIDSIAAGQVPDPSTDAQAVYVVFAPAGKQTSDGGGATLGEHGNFTSTSGAVVTWGWVKNLTKVVNDATHPMSHEIVEMLTDPDVNISGQVGYYIADSTLCQTDPGTNCEISDPCNTQLDFVNGVNVEAYWSDQDGTCVIPGAGGAPSGGATGPDGVKQIYAQDNTGASFFLGDANANDITGLSSGGDALTAGVDSGVNFWVCNGHAITYGADGLSGRTLRLDIQITGNQVNNWQSGAIQNGFIATANDFDGSESTIFIRPHTSLNVHTGVAFKPCGGVHSGTHDPRASAFEFAVPFQAIDKLPRYAKELNHPDYDYVSVNPNFTAYLVDNKWLGYKLVTWRNADGNSRTNRIYLNLTPYNTDGSVNNDHWDLYAEYIDKQGVNTGQYTQFVNWAGGAPHTFRSDGWDHIDFAKLSVFEIINPTVAAPPPSPKPPPPGGGSATDVFGIQKIYADRAGTYNNWHITTTSDSRFFEQNPVAVSGKPGWFTYPSLSQGRIEILSDPAITENGIPTYDSTSVIDTGYMWKPPNSSDGLGDFENVEITIKYQNVNLGSGSYEAHPELVYSGMRQTSDTTLAGADNAVAARCEAMSYHGNLYQNRIKYEKDSRHTDGYAVDSSNPQKTGLPNAWPGPIIHKMICIRVPNSSIRGGYAIKLEQWTDRTGRGDTFKKEIETVDDGHWGPVRVSNSGCNCPAPFSGSSGDFVVMNACKATIGIRIDFMNSFEFSAWSVRSIDKDTQLVTG